MAMAEPDSIWWRSFAKGLSAVIAILTGTVLFATCRPADEADDSQPLLIVFLGLLLQFVPLIIWCAAEPHTRRRRSNGCPRCGRRYPATVRVCPECDQLRCRTCNYNLTGNVSGRCPECGRTVHDVQCRACGHNVAGSAFGHCPVCGAMLDNAG